MASVLRHLLTGGLLVALDFLVFWMLDQGRHLVEKDVVARGETLMCDALHPVMSAVVTVGACPAAPVVVAVQVGGTGYLSDIFRDLVATFDLLQGGNITVISRKCLLQPSQPDHASYFILGRGHSHIRSHDLLPAPLIGSEAPCRQRRIPVRSGAPSRRGRRLHAAMPTPGLRFTVS